MPLWFISPLVTTISNKKITKLRGIQYWLLSHGDLCYSDVDKDSVWLIAPLIAKLPGMVQGRILKHAGQVLETGNNFWTAKNTKERERYLQKRHRALFFILVLFTGINRFPMGPANFSQLWAFFSTQLSHTPNI